MSEKWRAMLDEFWQEAPKLPESIIVQNILDPADFARRNGGVVDMNPRVADFMERAFRVVLQMQRQDRAD